MWQLHSRAGVRGWEIGRVLVAEGTCPCRLVVVEVLATELMAGVDTRREPEVG